MESFSSQNGRAASNTDGDSSINQLHETIMSFLHNAKQGSQSSNQ